jgi:hypothetical protein
MSDESTRKPFEMLRSFVLADFLTMANAACTEVAGTTSAESTSETVRKAASAKDPRGPR